MLIGALNPMSNFALINGILGLKKRFYSIRAWRFLHWTWNKSLVIFLPKLFFPSGSVFLLLQQMSKEGVQTIAFSSLSPELCSRAAFIVIVVVNHLTWSWRGKIIVQVDFFHFELFLISFCRQIRKIEIPDFLPSDWCGMNDVCAWRWRHVAYVCSRCWEHRPAKSRSLVGHQNSLKTHLEVFHNGATNSKLIVIRASCNLQVDRNLRLPCFASKIRFIYIIDELVKNISLFFFKKIIDY